MADDATDTKQQADAAQEPQQVDWQAKYEAMRAHSREWEKRAKASETDAAELEKLKAEKQSADAELEQMRAEAARREAVTKVADRENVPVGVVEMLNGADADELAKQVETLLKLLPAYPTRTDDGGTKAVAKRTNSSTFGELVGSMLTR
jgi:hypothetical protein